MTRLRVFISVFLFCAAGLLIGGCASSQPEPSDGAALSSEAAESAGPVRVSPRLVGGRKAFYDAFAFPRDDMDRAEERTVRVRLLIEADGAVEVQEVVQSSGVFAIDRAVVETITSLEWEPGTEDGEPVPVRMTIPFVLRTSP